MGGLLLATSTTALTIAPTFAPASTAMLANSSIQPTGFLTAQGIAAQTTVSSAHQPGVENDLSPLAEASSGIVIWDTPESYPWSRS
jgi:hypothetical protein